MAEKTVNDTTTELEVHAGEAKPPMTREETRFIIPPVDIYETEEGLVVAADLPGVEKDAVDIRVDNSILTIQGTVRRQTMGTGVYNEYALLDYFRQFQLNDRVDQEHISAELKNGVLTIKLPKAEKAKPKQIAVTVS